MHMLSSMCHAVYLSGCAVVLPMEKLHEFICTVTSYFGRNGGDGMGGNVGERFTREHKKLVVGENGQ